MPTMKDSKVPWLYEIPSSWSVERVKDGFYLKKSKAYQLSPVILSLARDGVKIRDISTNEGQIAASYYEYNKVDIDDMLLNTMDLQSGDNCCISKVRGVISPAYANLRYKSGYNPNFYNYYFKYQYWCKAFFTFGKGVSFDNRWTLNNETLMKFPLLKPPLEEQNAIVNFLDKKNMEIENLIKKIEAQIDVLKKYKIRYIDESFKSDKYIKLKMLGEFQNGSNFSTSDLASDIPFLGVGDFKDKFEIVSIDEVSKMPICTYITPSSYLKKGDIIFVRSNGSKDLVGRSVMININEPIVFSGFCIRFRNESEYFINKYLLYYFQSSFFRNEINKGSMGTNINNLSQDILRNVLIPIVSIEKQKTIAALIEEKNIEIDSIIDDKIKQLELINEYRKSLIYECITGKKVVN